MDTSVWLEWVLIYTLSFPASGGLAIERHEVHEEVQSTESACKHAKLELKQMYRHGRIDLRGVFCEERLKEYD